MNPTLTTRTEVLPTLWDRIDSFGAAWDPALHTFHARISEGEADPREIFLHASEFEHMAAAGADLSRRVAGLAESTDASRDLTVGALEDRERLTLWRHYARALGWGPSMAAMYAEDPLPQTVECARTWKGGAEEELPAALVRLYATSVVTTRVAHSLEKGLRLHYGFAGDPGLRFFELQARQGTARCGVARLTLETLSDRGDEGHLATLAESIHRSYWAAADGLTDLMKRG